MAVLIIGGGSAGRRHARLASEIGLGPVTLISKSAPSDSADSVLRDLGEVDFSSGFTLAIVASPAPFHAGHLRTLADHPFPILVEKPLAESFPSASDILALPELAAKTRVGYNLRLDSGFQTLMEILRSATLGSPLRIHAYAGQDLRRWRPGSDYRETVTARSDLGGGVLLELSHEIDYLIQLAGRPISVSGRVEKISELEIDVEDTTDLELTFESGLRASLHLNMVQFPFRRFCTVICADGTAEWDLTLRTVRHQNRSENDWTIAWSDPAADEDATYRLQLYSMLENPAALATPQQAATVLQVIDAARLSSRDGRKEIFLAPEAT